MRTAKPRRTSRPRLLGAALALAAATAASLGSTAAAAVPFDVRIYDRTEHRYLPTYEFQGRLYVVGKPGNEYAVSLATRSGERVLAVASVDGVNIVSGETASPGQTGYVLGSGQSAEIKGWRKSLSHTAAFYFTEHQNSYAARTGRPNDVGVIGVALFRERRVEPPVVPYAPEPRSWDERNRRDGPRPYGQAGSAAPSQGSANEAADAAPPPSSPSASGYAQQPSESARRAEKSLGTGHGRFENSQTRYTDFQRASVAPEQVVTIYYDTYSNLYAMGVPVWRDGWRDEDYAWRKPRPFPRDPTYGFVPDPR
jgi:hypothetical protein